MRRSKGKVTVENTSQTNGAIRSWFSALKHSWRTVLQIDRSQVTAIRAIRSAIGIALPLALGVATGHVIEGVQYQSHCVWLEWLLPVNGQFVAPFARNASER